MIVAKGARMYVRKSLKGEITYVDLTETGKSKVNNKLEMHEKKRETGLQEFRLAR